MSTKLLWKIFDKLVVTSKSSSHQSHVVESRITDGVPIWLHGFGRSGTTTAQKRVCDALDYNGIFEPLHPNRDSLISDDSLFEEVSRIFRSVPPTETWDAYVHPEWMRGSLETFGDGWKSMPEALLFERFLDEIYERYGHRLLVKEIRMFGNLELIAHYHEKRSIPFCFLGMIANPVVPLYAYYRRGYLARGFQSWKYRIDNLYRYRIEFSRLSGRHHQIAGLPAETKSEKFLVACLIDNAELRYFVEKDPTNRKIGNLQNLNDSIDWLSGRIGTPRLNSQETSSISKVGEGVDRWFYRDIIESLSPSIRSVLENHWGAISPQTDGKKRSNWKRIAVSYRHNHLDRV